jgi:DNA-directed RNA polymerase specialized sigma24 family protein
VSTPTAVSPDLLTSVWTTRYERIRAWAYAMTHDEDVALDVASDACVAMAESIVAGTAPADCGDRWARDHAWSALRRLRGRLVKMERMESFGSVPFSDPFDADEATPSSDGEAMARALRVAVNALPPRLRHVVVAVHFNGEKPTRLARREGMRPSAVTSALSDARFRLWRMLGSPSTLNARS